MAMASLDFNIGTNGYGMVLEKMNVETGIHLDAHILRSTKRRRADATRHASEQLKKLHSQIKYMPREVLCTNLEDSITKNITL